MQTCWKLKRKKNNDQFWGNDRLQPIFTLNIDGEKLFSPE